MGGFKYKGKEGGEMFLEKSYANERFTLMGVALLRDPTVYIIYNVIKKTECKNMKPAFLIGLFYTTYRTLLNIVTN